MVLRTILDLYGSRKNLFLNRSSLNRLQVKKLRALLAYAYDNVPFYHTKFKNARIRPYDVKTIDDLGKIPLTTKTDIQQAPLSQMIAASVNIDGCVKNRTSGSTGMPLITFADKRADALDAVMWRRANFENGMRLRDKIVEIRDPRNFHVKRWPEHLGILRTAYVSIFDKVEMQANFLTKTKPDIIESYPSSMEILANFFDRQKTSLRPRLVFTLAELLDGSTRQLITRTFETELFDYYGSSEIGLISWECREHAAYHTNADNVILEFADTKGDTVGTGELGDIVCTSLNNYAMPLIRYTQGDVGREIDGECSCGLKLPLMQIVGGRKDDFLTATDGRTIPPTVFFPYPFGDFEQIEQFRVVQEKKDQLEIQLVVKEGFNLQLLEQARKNIKRVFGEDMKVEFTFLKEMTRDPSGKLRKIIRRSPRT